MNGLGGRDDHRHYKSVETVHIDRNWTQLRHPVEGQLIGSRYHRRELKRAVLLDVRLQSVECRSGQHNSRRGKTLGREAADRALDHCQMSRRVQSKDDVLDIRTSYNETLLRHVLPINLHRSEGITHRKSGEIDLM